MMATISANQVIGSLIYRTREALRNDPKFLQNVRGVTSPYGVNYFPNGRFSIMHYPGTVEETKNTLLTLDKSEAIRAHKYPGVFNYEQKRRTTSEGYTTINFNLSFVAITDKNWLTEQREAYVFRPVLRPIFNEFLNQVKKAPFLFRKPQTGYPFTWYEVFTTGNYSETMFVPYGDWLDAIEVHNLQMTIKDCDYQYYKKAIEENNKLIEI